MANMTTSNNKWKLSQTIDAAGTITKTLNTAGKYIDKNIDIEIITPAAEFSTSGDTTTVSAGGFIASGVEVGSVSPGEITSGTCTPTIGDPTYNSTNSNFTISISGTIAAPSVNTAGYISSTIGTKNTNTLSGTKSLAKIGLGTVKDSGNLTVAPSIVRTAKPSGDTWTDAANGAVIQTKPTSGVYVRVDAASATNTLKIKGKVTTAGYGTTSQFTTSTDSYTVGAAAATTKYVPIKTATPAFDGGALNNKEATASATNATLETTNNSGISILAKGAAGRDAVLYNGAVNGYVVISDNASASAAIAKTTWDGTTYYLKNVTIPSSKTLSATNNGSLSIDNAGATTITSINKTAGTVTIAAYDTSSSSGVTSKQIVNNGIWTTTAVSATGTFYGRVTVGSGDYSATVASHTISTTPVVTPSISGTVTAISTTSVPTGTNGTDYWTLDPAGTVSTTGVSRTTAKATIDTAGYIGTGNKTTSNNDINIVPSIAAGTNRYIVKSTTTITNGTASATATAGTASVTTQPTANATATYSTSGISGGYYTDSTVSSYYITISANASSNSGTVSATGGNASASITASSITASVGYIPTAISASTNASSTGTKTGSSTATTAQTAEQSVSQTIYLKPATFANAGTSGITYTDISSSGPVLISNDYLYINAGYTPNVKISLAQLVPNGASANLANGILQNYSAYNNDGQLITGNIQSLGATVYNTSTTDQVIAAGKYLSGAQTIKAVTTTGITAENIKYNTVVKVGDANNAGRIKNITGTFTSANTVSSGQTAAAATQIRTGYSAWVNGAEVKGSMGTATFTYSGGGLTGQTASANFINANNKVITTSLSDDYNNGLTVQAKGTAGRAAINYTNTAGYIDAHSTASAISQVGTAISATTWNGSTYYLKGVKIAAPSSGTAKFDITIPNGNTTDFITFQFIVDSTGNVIIQGPDT